MRIRLLLLTIMTLGSKLGVGQGLYPLGQNSSTGVQLYSLTRLLPENTLIGKKGSYFEADCHNNFRTPELYGVTLSAARTGAKKAGMLRYSQFGYSIAKISRISGFMNVRLSDRIIAGGGADYWGFWVLGDKLEERFFPVVHVYVKLTERLSSAISIDGTRQLAGIRYTLTDDWKSECSIGRISDKIIGAISTFWTASDHFAIGAQTIIPLGLYGLSTIVKLNSFRIILSVVNRTQIGIYGGSGLIWY